MAIIGIYPIPGNESGIPNGDQDITGDKTFKDGATFEGVTTFDNDANFNSDTVFDGDTVFNGNITGIPISETVIARAHGTSTTNQYLNGITGTTIALGFQTKDSNFPDSVNTITTSDHVIGTSGATVFTAPYAGFYRFYINIHLEGNVQSDAACIMKAYINNSDRSLVRWKSPIESGANHTYVDNIQLSDVVYMNTSDELSFSIYGLTGGAGGSLRIKEGTSYSHNYFYVIREPDNT